MAKLAASLADRGVQVERRSPPGFDFESAWQTCSEMLGAEVGAALPIPYRQLFQLYFLTTYGRDPLAAAVARGGGFGVRQYVAMLARRDALIASMERFLAGWDVWLCPVSTVPAIPHCKTGASVDVDGVKRTYLFGLGGYVTVFSLTGNPVVVLPLERGRSGLPIGVQVVARRWSDMHLLGVAEQLATVTGAFQRPPGF
jgi:amidase